MTEDKKKLRRAYGATHSTAAKTVAFIFCILMLFVTAVSVLGAVIMWQAEVYGYSEESLRDEAYENVLSSYVYNTLFYSKVDSDAKLKAYIEQTNIGRVRVKGAGYDIDLTLKPVDERFEYSYSRIKVYESSSSGVGDYVWSAIIDEDTYDRENMVTVTFTVASELTVPDGIYWSNILIRVMYALRFWIYPIGICALLTAVLCFVFLMCAAGKRRGVIEVTPSNLTKVPFEIPTFLLALLVIECLTVIDLIDHDDLALTIGLFVSGMICAVGALFWMMSLAIRIKLGTIFKNTIIYRILRYIGLSIRVIWRSTAKFIKSIPLVWKTVIVVGVLFLAEFFSMVIFLPYNAFLFIFLWIITRIFLAVAITCVSIMMKDLQKGGKAIASGDFENKIDTTYLILDFKEHGEDLNRIGEGINRAVDERMKSERMKTELITNVSHDIKTPLTSIINYSDLICREECDNENIKEYSAILHNQSERMKRLIDDLVEASKASSGNIDIMLAECDARVLVSQSAGEYSQRLADAGLELVCSAPENEIRIMADGRRMWRVLDNLMNNVRKYALPGTRVYFGLEEHGGQAIFSIKNVSREALTVNADELSERFVRGDASRNTEGNGLGLSIAKSLTELQGGKFDIIIDGDLFKVTLTFEKVK